MGNKPVVPTNVRLTGDCTERILVFRWIRPILLPSPMSRPSAINHLAKHIPFLFPTRPASEREAHLYLDRALKAAAEERYDVALVFSRKALDVEPGNLAAQLLSAQLYEIGRAHV